MSYVNCLNVSQTVCTHEHCVTHASLCEESHPEHPWRKCINVKGHKGKHYVPPTSFNYEYWDTREYK